jgi:hypothetical protein
MFPRLISKHRSAKDSNYLRGGLGTCARNLHRRPGPRQTAAAVAVAASNCSIHGPK